MKNNIVTKILIIYTVLIGMLGILLKDNEISKTERRKLKQAPVLNYEKVVDGSYFTDLDDYTLDQMPARDVFRKIKGITSKYLLNVKEENGVYEKDGYLFEITKTSENSLDYFVNKINEINKNFKANTYFVKIPDKEYYEDNIIKKDYKLIDNKLKNLDKNINVAIVIPTKNIEKLTRIQNLKLFLLSCSFLSGSSRLSITLLISSWR